MPETYDVIIVGAGPAGIFCALELGLRSDLSVLVLEQGLDLDARVDAVRDGTARECRPLMCGWGGAGAFSDGKLNVSPEIGGHLPEYVGMAETEELVRQVDERYQEFGAPEEVFDVDIERAEEVARRATLAELQLITSRLRHMGTDRTTTVLANFRDGLPSATDVRTGTRVERVHVEEGFRLELATGGQVRSRYLVLAPGRSGADWLASELKRLGVPMARNPVDLGVRVEIPNAVLHDLTRDFYELKLIYFGRTFDTRVRTFCMCPQGEVVEEEHQDVTLVNGHSYARHKTDNTNFAILVSSTFTEPFDDPIQYGMNIARVANLLAGGVLVQRLGDLRGGRRSTPDRLAHGLVRPTLTTATPGDLSFALPHRHLTSILEMLEALDRFAPGVGSRHTLLYGVEAKFYSSRSQATAELETTIPNLFAIGDGAGLTRGLVQASASGLVAARAVASRAS